MRRVGEAVAPIAACVALLTLAIAVVASACGSSTLGSTSVTSCHVNADCPSGDGCQFSVYESCGSLGACIANVDGTACVEQTACGCNGATTTVCLVNGNSPSAVQALGSCDGSVQTPSPQSDSGTATPEAAAPGDAGDAAPAPSDDSGSPPDDANNTPDAADAADAAPASLLGTTCSSSTQCQSDPVYSECETVSGTKICTAFCLANGDCQPPANGKCDLADNYCELQ